MYIKQLFQQPQKLLAKVFLLLFPLSTILMYREPIINGYKWEYGTLGFYGIEIIGWIFIVSVLFQLLKKTRTEKVRFTWTRDRLFVVSMLMCLLYGVVSTFWAIDADLAQQQSVRVMFAALIFLSLPMVLNRKEIVQTLVAGALLPIGIGMYQFFLQALPGSTLLGMSGREISDGGVSIVQFADERWLRAYGTFAHPNVFGGYLAIVIMSVLLSLKHFSKKYVYVFLFLASSSLVLTMSRSAWCSLIIGTVILVYLNKYTQDKGVKKWFYEALSIVFVSMFVVSILLWPLVSVRLGVSSYHEKVSIAERAALQDTAMDLFIEHPILGVGAGNMTAALQQTDDTKFGYVYQPVHNVLMLLLVEYGVIGVLLLLVSCILGFTLFFSKSPEGYILLAAVPLVFLDHYLITSVHGLGIGAIFLSILVLSSRKFTQIRG